MALPSRGVEIFAEGPAGSSVCLLPQQSRANLMTCDPAPPIAPPPDGSPHPQSCSGHHCSSPWESAFPGPAAWSLGSLLLAAGKTPPEGLPGCGAVCRTPSSVSLGGRLAMVFRSDPQPPMNTCHTAESRGLHRPQSVMTLCHGAKVRGAKKVRSLAAQGRTLPTCGNSSGKCCSGWEEGVGCAVWRERALPTLEAAGTPEPWTSLLHKSGWLHPIQTWAADAYLVSLKKRAENSCEIQHRSGMEARPQGPSHPRVVILQHLKWDFSM